MRFKTKTRIKEHKFIFWNNFLESIQFFLPTIKLGIFYWNWPKFAEIQTSHFLLAQDDVVEKTRVGPDSPGAQGPYRDCPHPPSIFPFSNQQIGLFARSWERSGRQKKGRARAAISLPKTEHILLMIMNFVASSWDKYLMLKIIEVCKLSAWIFWSIFSRQHNVAQQEMALMNFPTSSIF